MKVDIIIFVLAFVMLVLSLATPFTYARIDFESHTEYKTQISLLDGIRFFVASLFFYDDQELADLNYFSKGESDGYSEYSVPEQFSFTDRSAGSFKKLLMLTFMSLKTNLRATTIVNAIINIIYLIILFVAALMSLLRLLSGFLNGKIGQRLRSYASVRSEKNLMRALFFIPIVIFSNLHMSNIGYSSVFFEMRVTDVGAGAGFYLLLVLLLAANGWVVYNNIVSRGDSVSKAIKEFGIKETISAICVLLIAISVFLPCISLSITRTTSGSSETTVQPIFMSGMTEFDYRTGNYYNRLTEDETVELIQNSWAKRLSRYEASNGVLNRVLLKNDRSFANTIYFSLFLLAIIILFVCAKILMLQIAVFMKQADRGKKKKGARIFLTVLTAIVLAVVSITLVALLSTRSAWTTSGANYYLEYGMGIAPTLSLMSAIVLCFSFSKESKKKNLPSYDNPDISYAPYVVK